MRETTDVFGGPGFNGGSYSLFFSSHEILNRGRGLTYDDVLLVPRHSEIHSRLHPKLSTQITKKWKIDIPILSANMDTVTEKEMIFKLAKMGGVGILHRFMTLEEQKNQIREIRKYFDDEKINLPVMAAIGVKSEGLLRGEHLIDEGVDILTVDVAHGDGQLVFEILDTLKKKYPHIEIIAGNVATSTGTKGLIEHGADAIKVGIGPGSMCTTRIVTGCGVPQLTAIGLCSQVAKIYNIPIIADGGIRNSGDVVKSLCAGANSVMLGSLFSGCLETPGEIVQDPHQNDLAPKKERKLYRGMASKEAQENWYGELSQHKAPEGVATWVDCKGSVERVVDEILGGIRSGMTYLNSSSIEDLSLNALFIETSNHGLRESMPHGKISHPFSH